MTEDKTQIRYRFIDYHMIIYKPISYLRFVLSHCYLINTIGNRVETKMFVFEFGENFAKTFAKTKIFTKTFTKAYIFAKTFAK
jgi:hypothetical protein